MTDYSSGMSRVKKVERISVTVTTDGSGDAVVKTPELTGRVLQMRYTPPGADELDTGADLVIATESGVALANHENIGTTAFTRAYRQQVHLTNSNDADYSTDNPVVDYVWVADECLVVTISNGGASKSGTFEFYIG